MMIRGAPGSPGTPAQAHNAGRPLLKADLTPISHITSANAIATSVSEPVRGEQEETDLHMMQQHGHMPAEGHARIGEEIAKDI